MEKIKILFICTYHGGRSRMAEEFAKRVAPNNFKVSSSSFEPGKIGTLPITIMKEIGIELPTTTPKSVFERYKDGEVYDYVITLCNDSTAELCPIFKTNVDALYAKKAKRISWTIPDLKSLKGTEKEKLTAARKIRESIKTSVINFFEQIGAEVSNI